MNVSSGGTGYTGNTSVIFSSPETSWGIPASGIAEVKNGSVTKVEIVSSGRGYGSTPPTVTFGSPNVGINTAIGVANLIPSYYTIQSSTPIISGICTITLNDSVPFNVGVGTTTFFFKQRFDAIFHQHLNYFDEYSIQKLISSLNCKLLSLESNLEGSNGGSLS